MHYTGWLYQDGAKGQKFDSSLDRGRPFERDHSAAQHHAHPVGDAEPGAGRLHHRDAVAVGRPGAASVLVRAHEPRR